MTSTLSLIVAEDLLNIIKTTCLVPKKSYLNKSIFHRLVEYLTGYILKNYSNILNSYKLVTQETFFHTNKKYIYLKYAYNMYMHNINAYNMYMYNINAYNMYNFITKLKIQISI